MYDLIGDVHGFVDELVVLLKQLGYTKIYGSWKHPERKLIFVGDLIDRGPKVRETINLVRKMVESGDALVVMGNHEYNAICYHTKHRTTGEYLRKHTENNIKQHAATLNSFLGKNSELTDCIQWFRQLPVYIETNGLRVCHASWIPEHIGFLKKITVKPLLDDSFLERSVIRDSHEFSIITELLKGIEIKLPREFYYEVDGLIRDKMRVKWWKDNYRSLKDMAIGPRTDVPDSPCPPYFIAALPSYTEIEPPVFIGHYGIGGPLRLMKSNICCLDFNISKGGKLVAYRWDGENVLSESKMVSVDFGSKP